APLLPHRVHALPLVLPRPPVVGKLPDLVLREIRDHHTLRLSRHARGGNEDREGRGGNQPEHREPQPRHGAISVSSGYCKLSAHQPLTRSRRLCPSAGFAGAILLAGGGSDKRAAGERGASAGEREGT